MYQKLMAGMMGIGSAVLVGCAGDTGSREPALTQVAATGTEESLQQALSVERRRAGKSELPVSPALARLARAESDAAAASSRLPGDNSDSLRMRSGFKSMGKLQGVLKDRGTQTGAGFVEYWAKGDREMLQDDWSNIGVGISKAADGRLFAVVLLGGQGGTGALMDPALAPSGFRRR